MSQFLTFDLAIPPNLNYPSELFENLEAIRMKINFIVANEISADFITDGVLDIQDGNIRNVRKISGLLEPTGPTDAANKAYVDATNTEPKGPDMAIQFNDNGKFAGSSKFSFVDTSNTLLLDGTFSNGFVTIDQNTISGLGSPVNPTDAANKEYVDNSLGQKPGAPASAVQFNSDPAGTFTGSSDFTFDSSTSTLSLEGDFEVVNVDASASVSANNVSANNVIGTTVSGSTLTDGFATLSNGQLSDVSEINMQGLPGRITGLQAPVDPTDAANKAYVDSISGTPGGVNTQVQFNDNGSFGGSPNLTYTTATNTFQVSGNIIGTTITGTTISDGIASMTSGVISDGTATMASGVINNVSRITGLNLPLVGTDAASKNYVDSVSGSAAQGPAGAVQYNSTATIGSFAGSGDLLFTPGTTNVLGLNGNFNADGIISFTNTQNSTDSTNGTLVVSGGVGVALDMNVGGTLTADELIATSDMELKTNIQGLNKTSLEMLSKIECYSYNLKNSNVPSFGVMAQQLEEIGLEQVVKRVGDHKGVSYLQLIALLIDSVKQLNDELNHIKKYHFNDSREKKEKKMKLKIFKDPRPTDRKRMDGQVYKFCFECKEWMCIDQFIFDSNERDSLSRICKIH